MDTNTGHFTPLVLHVQGNENNFLSLLLSCTFTYSNSPELQVPAHDHLSIDTSILADN